MSKSNLLSARKMPVIFAIILVLVFSNSIGFACHDYNARGKHWVGTWAASLQKGETIIPGFWEPAIPEINNGTLRQVVRTSISGNTIRIKLSNEFGALPLKIGAARIALSVGGESIEPDTSRVLTFGGKTSTVIPAGDQAVSDPVNLNIKALSDLAISLYFPEESPMTTYHYTGSHTTYLASSGDYTNATVLPTTKTSSNYYILSGVDVLTSKKATSIVAFGDSITDGYASTVGGNKQWPSVLAARLQNYNKLKNLSVLNSGISGNRILNEQIGPSALSRLERDVIKQEGVKYVIFMMGINDIGFSGGAFGFPPQPVTADDIIAGHRQVIACAHEKGYIIYGATLTPCNGVGSILGGTYDTPEGEAIRQAVNNWIRTSGEYDGVIDFDSVVRDPSDPTRILPAYDGGDHLHLNDAGYEAMGNAINLELFENK